MHVQVCAHTHLRVKWTVFVNIVKYCKYCETFLQLLHDFCTNPANSPILPRTTTLNLKRSYKRMLDTTGNHTSLCKKLWCLCWKRDFQVTRFVPYLGFPTSILFTWPVSAIGSSTKYTAPQLSGLVHLTKAIGWEIRSSISLGHECISCESDV